MANLAAGSSAQESASLTLDKTRGQGDSLESKLLKASSEKISCLQETVFLLNLCQGIIRKKYGHIAFCQSQKQLQLGVWVSCKPPRGPRTMSW